MRKILLLGFFKIIKHLDDEKNNYRFLFRNIK